MYGFIYIWFDKKHKRYYIGCHWGTKDDGYICSSAWMNNAYKRRPKDFKRRIIETNIESEKKLYETEMTWLGMIKEHEIKPNTVAPRYYNLNIKNNNTWRTDSKAKKTIATKISETMKAKHDDPEYRKIYEAGVTKRDNSWITEEVRERKRQSMIGKNVGKDTSKAVAASAAKRTGVPLSSETKQKIASAGIFKNLNAKRVKCNHCDTWGNPGNIGRYHNDKCKAIIGL